MSTLWPTVRRACGPPQGTPTALHGSGPKSGADRKSLVKYVKSACQKVPAVKVTLTVESATALRNLHDAPADEEAGPGAAAQGRVAAQTPHRDGAARPMPGDGNKRQRPNPRPDLKRGREAEERATGRAARPSHTEMNTRNKRRLEALSRRYPAKLELRVPHGATPVNLRMQALTAARFDDILAHVTFTGTGSRDSRLYPLWDQTRIWDPGD